MCIHPRHNESYQQFHARKRKINDSFSFCLIFLLFSFLVLSIFEESYQIERRRENALLIYGQVIKDHKEGISQRKFDNQTCPSSIIDDTLNKYSSIHNDIIAGNKAQIIASTRKLEELYYCQTPLQIAIPFDPLRLKSQYPRK